MLQVGDKVRFFGETRPYTVRAVNDRYAVCTKPFNPRHTVLYTVIDFAGGVRGTENLIFCAGAETEEQCREMLARITSGDTSVSRRNRVPLDILQVNDRVFSSAGQQDAGPCTHC